MEHASQHSSLPNPPFPKNAAICNMLSVLTNGAASFDFVYVDFTTGPRGAAFCRRRFLLIEQLPPRHVAEVISHIIVVHWKTPIMACASRDHQALKNLAIMNDESL